MVDARYFNSIVENDDDDDMIWHFVARIQDNLDNSLNVSRSLGGEVSWDESVAVGSTFEESDDGISHQIVDRPLPKRLILSRSVICIYFAVG